MWWSVWTAVAHGFCGTYVGTVDGELYNHAAKVYVARQGIRTTLTVKNEYQGNLDEFALLMPIPQIVHRDDVTTVPTEVLDRIDTYTGPRLVEYSCNSGHSGYWGGSGYWYYSYSYSSSSTDGSGVVVHDQFFVGAYEIVILSAEQSSGLLRWLNDNGYATSSQARGLLQEYIDQGSYFFAAKVSLRGSSSGSAFLEPLRVSYDNGELGLPIRLGTLNAGGCDQDLLVTVFTPETDGRVEITNYPEVTVPDDCLWDSDDFRDVSALYDYSFRKVMQAQPGPAWVTEYGWASGSCDPCPAGGLSSSDLSAVGFTLPVSSSYATRLHLRYDPSQVTQELRFRTTGDRSSIQQRYVVDDHAHRDQYPVCERGWDPAPEDCDGQLVAAGGPGPFVTGPLPPLEPEPASCPLPPLDPPNPRPADPTPTPGKVTGGGGCGCDQPGSGASLAFALAGLIALRSARRPHPLWQPTSCPGEAGRPRRASSPSGSV